MCNFTSPKRNCTYLQRFFLKFSHLSDLRIHFIVVIVEFPEITEAETFLFLDMSHFGSALFCLMAMCLSSRRSCGMFSFKGTPCCSVWTQLRFCHWLVVGAWMIYTAFWASTSPFVSWGDHIITYRVTVDLRWCIILNA